MRSNVEEGLRSQTVLPGLVQE